MTTKHAKHVGKHAKDNTPNLLITDPIPILVKKKKKPYQLRRILLGIPALFPLICVYPDIVLRRAAYLNNSAADILGTGAEITLLITLLISPLILLTGKRWIFPLRKWYGIMTGVIAVVAGILSPILSLKFGPAWMVVGNLSLATGYILVVLLLPLLLTSNKWSAKRLGKYWPKIQSRLTYAVWFLLGFHLLVLFGIEPNANGSFVHQRFYLYVLCSVTLFVYRLPVVKKAITHLRKAGFNTAIYVMSIPWIALFVVPFSYIVNEEVFKGVAILTNHGTAN